MKTPRSNFRHSRGHRDKPGEPKCKRQTVPAAIVELLRQLPAWVLSEACARLGHPSFWLRPGYRYACICGEITYHD